MNRIIARIHVHPLLRKVVVALSLLALVPAFATAQEQAILQYFGTESCSLEQLGVKLIGHGKEGFVSYSPTMPPGAQIELRLPQTFNYPGVTQLPSPELPFCGFKIHPASLQCVQGKLVLRSVFGTIEVANVSFHLSESFWRWIPNTEEMLGIPRAASIESGGRHLLTFSGRYPDIYWPDSCFPNTSQGEVGPRSPQITPEHGSGPYQSPWGNLGRPNRGGCIFIGCHNPKEEVEALLVGEQKDSVFLGDKRLSNQYQYFLENPSCSSSPVKTLTCIEDESRNAYLIDEEGYKYVNRKCTEKIDRKILSTPGAQLYAFNECK